jgi:hypothetical protein
VLPGEGHRSDDLPVDVKTAISSVLVFFACASWVWAWVRIGSLVVRAVRRRWLNWSRNRPYRAGRWLPWLPKQRRAALHRFPRVVLTARNTTGKDLAAAVGALPEADLARVLEHPRFDDVVAQQILRRQGLPGPLLGRLAQHPVCAEQTKVMAALLAR